MATYFKIRRPDGMYSAGGYWPQFSRRGKTWRSLHALHSHLSGVGSKISEYDNCELIEIESIEKEVMRQPIRDYIDNRNAKRAATAAEERRQRAEAQKIREETEARATYEKLKIRFAGE